MQKLQFLSSLRINPIIQNFDQILIEKREKSRYIILLSSGAIHLKPY